MTMLKQKLFNKKMVDNCMLENVSASIKSELSLLIKLSITDIARKCHVDNLTVIRFFMKEELEQLLIDMRNSADYSDNEDLHYYAEELEEILHKNFSK